MKDRSIKHIQKALKTIFHYHSEISTKVKIFTKTNSKHLNRFP